MQSFVHKFIENTGSGRPFRLTTLTHILSVSRFGGKTKPNIVLKYNSSVVQNMFVRKQPYKGTGLKLTFERSFLHLKKQQPCLTLPSLTRMRGGQREHPAANHQAVN